jgi:hypothetical protein
MTTLKQLNSEFNEFDEFVRNLVNEQGGDDEKIIDEVIDKVKAKWFDMFDDTMDDESAIGIINHYKELKEELEMARQNKTETKTGGSKAKSMKNLRRTKQTKKIMKMMKMRKQKGGMAPIGADMSPGFPSMQTYGSFPSDITSTTSIAKALDIIGGNPGLSSSCGKEAHLFPTPAPSMGSNKVGGSRQTKKNKKSKQSEKQSGGGLLDALSMRAYIPTIPQNINQTAQTTYQGVAQPPSGDPTDAAWKYSSATSGGVINPAITKIGSDINQLASPAPWGKN